MPSQYLPFHDGHLLGVRVGEKTATLFLSKEDGTEHELLLSGVERLRMDEFMEGNIIHSIQVMTGERPPANFPLDQLFGSLHPAAAEKYHLQHEAFVERQLAEVESGAASLVILTPSYGADLLALCRAVTLRTA